MLKSNKASYMLGFFSSEKKIKFGYFFPLGICNNKATIKLYFLFAGIFLSKVLFGYSACVAKF